MVAGERSVADRRKERAEASREAIVLAAAQTFADYGYHQASITRIVDSMELTEGAIYHHFKNKAELAVAVLDELYRRWEQLRDEVTAEAEERGLDGLAAVQLSNLRVADRFQHDLIVQAGTRLGYERELIPTRLPTPFVGWYPFVDHHLRRAQLAGLMDEKWDRAAVGRMIVASFLGIQDVSRRTTDRADLIERVEEWWQMLVEGFAPRD